MSNFISSPKRTKEILKKYGFSFKKSLGQNFLIDPNILEKIVDKAEIDKETGVIEIGPGIGALTQRLSERAKKVIAIEIDQRLFPILNETLAEYPNSQVIHGDILKIPLEELIREKLNDCLKIKIVANLPYYITTPIIMKLLEDKLPIESLTVMVQKEVGERINAIPGTKEYGSLTLAIEYFAKSELLFTVPKGVFMPPPNVDSTILQLRIKKQPGVIVKNEDLLFKVIRASFAQRRKTLLNNLLNSFFNKELKEDVEGVLRKVGIDPQRRGETLTLSEFAKLAGELEFLMAK